MSEPAPAVPGPAARPARRWWIALLGLAALALVAWLVRRGAAPPAAGGGPAARPVPVVVAAVVRRDVPVTQDGIGTVVANRTVTVRPQVDGRLDQVLFQEGQAVRRGQVLAQLDARPFRIQLAQAEGALARDQAQLASARADLARYRALAQERLVSQQQADQQVAVVGQLEGAVRVDQAAIDAAQLNLDYARITAPVDGVTGIRQVDPGNLVRAADPTGIVLVTQLDPIAVLFTLPQDQLPAVAEAMARGPLEVTVFARDGATVLGTGKLKLVDNQINQATATLRLKAELPNPQRRLWPNQFVKVRLGLAVQRGALVMPASALLRGPSGPFAYVAAADGTVSPRPVEAGLAAGETVVVTKGLAEGEKVVTDGQGQLRPGAKVAAREAGVGAGGPGGGPGRGAEAAAGPRGTPP